MIRLHPHAKARIEERGASEAEVVETILSGERFEANFDRTGFRLDFGGPYRRRGKTFDTKRIEAYAVFEDGDWLVITVIVKFWSMS